MTKVPGDHYRAAARAYFVYGVVYLVGGVYLILQGVGVRGSPTRDGLVWVVIGVGLVVGIPFLLRRPRMWFERWVLSRRDFARVVAAFMAFRALALLRVALRPEAASVPAPWGGEISFRVGAAMFFVVTIAALALVARAAWSGQTARA